MKSIKSNFQANTTQYVQKSNLVFAGTLNNDKYSKLMSFLKKNMTKYSEVSEILIIIIGLINQVYVKGNEHELGLSL